MRQRFLVSLVISLGLSFSSCRKGAEDPFLSLRSRTARVAGDWTVVSYNKQQVTQYAYPDGSQYTQQFTSNFGPVNYQETSTDTGNTVRINTGKISRSEFHFTKSGNWNSLIEYYVYENQAVGGYYISKVRKEEDGTWSFNSKSGDLKNKESMDLLTKNSNSFYYTYSTYLGTVVDSVADSTYSSAERKATWKIIGLRNTYLKAEIFEETTLISAVSGIAGTKITTGITSEIEMKQ